MEADSSSSPWHLIQDLEAQSGGVGPPSSFEEPPVSPPYSLDEDIVYEPSIQEEAAWYGQVREADDSEGPQPAEAVTRRGLDNDQVTEDAHQSVWRGPSLTDEAFTKLAADASFKRMRLERPRHCWENSRLFGGSSSHLSLSNWLARPPSVGIRETLNRPEPDEKFGGEGAAEIPWTIEKKLRGMRLVKCDEDERNYALKKLKAVILLDPPATALGLSLVRQTGALESDEVVAANFCDAFSAKASGTPTKRASSLQRLVLQLYRQNVDSPWRITERDLYAALGALRDGGCGATAPAHILESLRFVHSIARFLYLDLEVVISARCRGVAHSCFLTKAPLVQRDPLTCEQVKLLEEKMVRAGPVVQCILGQILFCVHAVCRWKDSQRLKVLELIGSGESQILFGDALGSKTSLSKEAKTKLTPYAALAQGLTECNWGSLRLEAWGSTQMGAAEASAWMQELLV
ncbi:unnamed protein product, partial [Symbiodinium sp. CCMP2456]